MARYAAKLQKGTTSATIGVGSLEAPASSMRRILIYDFIVGSDAATPADNMFVFEWQRSTTAATGTAFVPVQLDSADAAAVSLPKTNLTVQGTNTASAILMSLALNQRATFRWVAQPGGELVIPATASNGLHLNTPTTTNTPSADSTVHFIEN